MQINYRPEGVCSQRMIIDVENGVITSAQIIGGCDGNTKGLCKLVVGMPVDKVISDLEGITCGRKPTSCPDQLSKALRKLKEQGA